MTSKGFTMSAPPRIVFSPRPQPDAMNFLPMKCLQIWVLHHLQILGEACRSLSAGFRERHPNDVWSKAAGLRNILVHHYFDIDAGIVWDVVDNDLRPLRELVLYIIGLGPAAE
jgi:uncharacterized protein with HEPN domain